ncbi:Hsp90 chaperone hsp82 [Binucleata daphniae]
MSTIIHSMYSSKEHSIKELVSNASDALTKYQSEYAKLKESFPNVSIASPSDLKIKVYVKNGMLFIEDNGIGMTKKDLIDLIGKIASSGTKQWKEAMNKDTFENAPSLIGQFGLGFYSAFLISDNVKVVTKHVSEPATVWECHGFGQYTLNEYEEEDKEEFTHGTRIILQVRESDSKYLGVNFVEDIIKKYSTFIPHSIYIYKEVEEDVEEPVVEDIDEAKEEVKENENEDVPEIKKEEDEKKQEKKKIKVVKQFLLNKEKPLWTKNPKDVTQEEYKSFYKAISNDWDDFMAVKHCKLEGMIALTFLLFIPKRNNNSMFEKQKKDNIKLYVQNVLITADLKDVVPDWMNFVCGVINSNDAPINVSREMLQGTKTYKLIKNNLVKKVIEAIEELTVDREKHLNFLKTFGTNLKMAVRDNTGAQQERIAKLLKFYSSKSTETQISLDEYMERNPSLNTIYILTGLSKEEVIKSPFLALYKNSEVLFMYEPIDEIMLQGFNKYKEWDIKRITSEGCSDFGKMETNVEEEHKPFLDAIKNELADTVEKVLLKNIQISPCIISSAAYSHSAAMEAIIRSQPGADANPFLQMMAKSKKILEIDPEHKIIKSIKSLFGNNRDEWKKQINLLFYTALIECGYKIDDGVVYAKKVYDLIGSAYQEKEVKKVEEIVEEEEVL